MSALTLEILAPETAPMQMAAREVILPGAAGVMTVRPGHTPVLTLLAPGVLLAYDAQGNKHFYAISGGFAEIKGDTVGVLTEAFEHGQTVNLARAEAARDRAEQQLHKAAESAEVERAEAAIARAIARINAHHGVEY